MLQRDMEEELGDGQPMFLGTWNDRGRIADADLLDKQRYVRRVRRNTWSRSAPPPRAPLSPLLRSSPLGSVGGGCGRSDGGVMEEVSSQDLVHLVLLVLLVLLALICVLWYVVRGALFWRCTALLWREEADTWQCRRAGGVD